MTMTCDCRRIGNDLVEVCALHGDYGMTMRREGAEQAVREQQQSKAPSHAMGRARVDVHERIHECENVINELNMLWQELHFGYRKVTNEDMINILMGMERLYHLRFARLKDEFEGYVRQAK